MQANVPLKRKCSKCGEVKNVSDFYPSLLKFNKCRCKSCCSEYQSAYQKKNPDKVRALQKRWASENSSRLALHKKNYQRENKDAISERKKVNYKKKRDEYVQAITEGRPWFDENEEKRCSDCGEIKKLGLFRPDYVGGFKSRCLKCYAKFDKDYAVSLCGKREEYQREWFQKNKDRIRERQSRNIRRWQKANRHRVREASHRRNARKNALPFDWKCKDMQFALEWWSNKCGYCGTELNVENLHFDHFVPVSKSGPTTPDNMIPACCTCNLSKGARAPGTFLIRKTKNARAVEVILERIFYFFQSVRKRK